MWIWILALALTSCVTDHSKWLTSLCLSLFICKVGLLYKAVLWIEWDNTYNELRIILYYLLFSSSFVYMLMWFINFEAFFKIEPHSSQNLSSLLCNSEVSAIFTKHNWQRNLQSSALQSTSNYYICQPYELLQTVNPMRAEVIFLFYLSCILRS